MLNRVGERLHNWPWAPQLVSGRARILHKQPDSLVQLSRVPISAVSLMITGSSKAKEFCHLKSVFEFSMVPSWLLQLPLSLSLCHLCTQIRSRRLLLSVDVSSCVAHLFRGSWHAHEAAFKICRNLQQALSVALKKKTTTFWAWSQDLQERLQPVVSNTVALPYILFIYYFHHVLRFNLWVSLDGILSVPSGKAALPSTIHYLPSHLILPSRSLALSPTGVLARWSMLEFGQRLYLDGQICEEP